MLKKEVLMVKQKWPDENEEKYGMCGSFLFIFATSPSPNILSKREDNRKIAI